MLDLEKIIKDLMGWFLIIFGWVVAHQLTAVRDRNNKRRESRVSYLICAYRNLEAASSREKIGGTDLGRNFESALADIQLLGTEKQAELALNLARGIAEKRPDTSAGPLLCCLRDDLRKELGLGSITTPPLQFRFSKDEERP